MQADRPRTVEQMAGLPVGPQFGQERRELSRAEIRRGFAIQHGERFDIRPGIKAVNIPVMRPVMASWHEANDPLGYTDRDGTYWSLGRYADGEWFRRRVGI